MNSRKEESRRYYLKHRNAVLLRVHDYRKKNAKEVRARARAKYARDPEDRERARLYRIEYLKKNRQKIYAYQRKYRNTILREWHNTWKRKWTKTPKGKLLLQAKAYRRRALMKNIGKHTTEEWNNVTRLHNNRCAICKKKKKLTKDHIIPLTKGGLNTINNIQPLCLPCNARKGNR